MNGERIPDGPARLAGPDGWPLPSRYRGDGLGDVLARGERRAASRLSQCRPDRNRTLRTPGMLPLQMCFLFIYLFFPKGERGGIVWV